MARCSAQCRSEASMTSRSRSARSTSSSVARKASTSWCGNLWMKPTVSVRTAWAPLGSFSRRLVGSSVAKSLSSASTSVLPTRLFSSVDLPALVYPTIATVGTPPAALAFAPVSRLRRTWSTRAFMRAIRSRINRLSVSSCDSPGPRVPMPPPVRDRCVQSRVRRGS